MTHPCGLMKIAPLTTGGGVHLDPLGLGLGDQAVAVVNLHLLSLVVLEGGQGVVVDVTVGETTNQGGPAGDLCFV